MILSGIFIQRLYMSIMAGYVVLAVMLARFLLRKCPKIYSYILWSLVAFRLLVPVSVSTSFSFFNLSSLPGIRTEAVVENSDLTSDLTNEDESVQAPPKREEQPVQLSPRQTATQATGNMATENMTAGGMAVGIRDRVPMIAPIIWLFGVGILFFYTLFRIISMKKQLTSAVLWKDNIYEADGIKSPFVFGVLRPRIYVPFSLEEVERDYILRHEKEHIRRGDHLIKYAAYMLAMVYWFHPLIWIAYHFMCQDMEMSCDEKVIKGLDEDKRKDYSRLLLSFAVEKRQFAGPLYFGENNVEKRITNILKSKKGGIAAAVLGLVLIGVLILLFATDAKKLKEEEIAADQEYLAMKEEEEKLLALQAEAEAERQIMEQEKENLLAMQAEAEAERQIMEQEKENLLAMQAEAEAEKQRGLYNTMKLLTEMAERDEYGYLTVKEAGYGLSYLNSSKDGSVTVYGCTSPDYGYRGVILVNELSGKNPYNYFDWDWETWATWRDDKSLPVMWNLDVDGDSETEFVIIDRLREVTYRDGAFGDRQQVAKYVPSLVVLETLDDGTMEATILDMDAIEQELSLLIEERPGSQEDSISIYIKGTGQVLLENVPNKDYEEKAFTVKYEGDQLKLLLYMESREEGIVFKIRYDESRSMGGYFTISDPKSFAPDPSM
ncbi:MAG: hypothetical protein J1E61_08345 [Lachnospiraceae bacterium]|nr:hypothetical protein [Lachnospiraceae bacterium]